MHKDRTTPNWLEEVLLTLVATIVAAMFTAAVFLASAIELAGALALAAVIFTVWVIALAVIWTIN